MFTGSYVVCPTQNEIQPRHYPSDTVPDEHYLAMFDPYVSSYIFCVSLHEMAPRCQTLKKQFSAPCTTKKQLLY